MNKCGTSADILIDLRSIASQNLLDADVSSDDDDAYSNDFDDDDDEEAEVDNARAFDQSIEAMVALAGVLERCTFNQWKESTKASRVTSRRGCARHRSLADESTPPELSEEEVVTRARTFNTLMCQIGNNRVSTLLLKALQKWCSFPQPAAPSSIAPPAVMQVRGKNVMAPFHWKALRKPLQQPLREQPHKLPHKIASEESAEKASPSESISPLRPQSLPPTPPPPPKAQHHHQLDGRYLNRRSWKLLASSSFREQSSRAAFRRPPPPLPAPPPPPACAPSCTTRTPTSAVDDASPSNPSRRPSSSSMKLADRAHSRELLEADVQRLLQHQACIHSPEHAELNEEEVANYAQVSIPSRHHPRPPRAATSHGIPKVQNYAMAVRKKGKDRKPTPAIVDSVRVRPATAERLSGSSTLAQQVANFRRSSLSGGDSVGLQVPLHLPLLSLIEGEKFTLRDLIQPHVLVV